MRALDTGAPTPYFTQRLINEYVKYGHRMMTATTT